MNKLIIFAIFFSILISLPFLKRQEERGTQKSSVAKSYRPISVSKINETNRDDSNSTGSQFKIDAEEIVILSSAHYEQQFAVMSDVEIQNEINSIKKIVELQNLIKKANEKKESNAEKILLNESIRKVGALYKILIDRRIQDVRERI